MHAGANIGSRLRTNLKPVVSRDLGRFRFRGHVDSWVQPPILAIAHIAKLGDQI